MQDEISEISDRMLDRAAAIAKAKGEKRASKFAGAAEKKRFNYHIAKQRGEENAEDRLEAYDPGTEFADRVMREAFDRMTKGELKDYDSKAMKPGSIRLSTPEERKKYAKVFQQSRGGAGEKVKKMRDLRKP